MYLERLGTGAWNVLTTQIVTIDVGDAIGTGLFKPAIVALAVWLVWRLISQRLSWPGQTAEPGRNEDSGVPARLRPSKAGAGAVALAEPEEDESQPASLDSERRRRASDQWPDNGQGDWTAT